MAVSDRRAQRIGALVAVAALGLALTACSTPAATTGDGSPTEAIPAAVTTNLDAYTGVSEGIEPGAAFDVSGVAGKNVWWVTQYSGNPFLATVGANFTKALDSVGVSVTTCDGKGNPVDANNCIRQAIAQGAAAIQVDGPEPATYASALTEANAAGIPVLAGASVDASTPLLDGLAGQTSQPFKLTGQLAADWIIKDSGGTANILFLTTPDVIGSVSEQEAFADEIKANCANCTITVKGVTLANWANDLGPTTSAELVKDPTINYVVPAFDPMTQFTNPAIQQSGRGGSTKVVTVNGNLGFMQDLASGTSLTVAMVGIDLNALGYVEADQLLRAMTGTPVVDVSYAPVRIFDTTSVGSLDLSETAANDGSWYAGTDKQSAKFAELWQK